jgi:hypothetical protein
MSFAVDAPCSDAFDPASVDFEAFGLFLEARRIHRGKTPGRVAREAGVALDAVFRAAGGRNPGAIEFFALADWIGEEPAFFLKHSAAGRKPNRASGEARPAGGTSSREAQKGGGANAS